ncbi:MAG TPA: antibiotic biosynthesis monooxygenase [Ilumatobacter sp.]|nr:antibiotic biosynthesis monooxygenase [Ilumatobacter sp.]
MFVIVWKYVVRPDAAQEFRAAYRSDGEWAQLFSRSPEFFGTELVSEPGSTTYLTIDRWVAAAAADAFIESVRDEYEELDERFAVFTESEQLVMRGHFVG